MMTAQPDVDRRQTSSGADESSWPLRVPDARDGRPTLEMAAASCAGVGEGGGGALDGLVSDFGRTSYI